MYLWEAYKIHYNGHAVLSKLQNAKSFTVKDFQKKTFVFLPFVYRYEGSPYLLSSTLAYSVGQAIRFTRINNMNHINFELIFGNISKNIL